MKFRARTRSDRAGAEDDKKILVVEDSRTFAMALRQFLELEIDRAVVTCASLKDLRETLARDPNGFTIAVVDLNLPDAPYGEALDFTIERGIPAVVFTASFDARTRTRIMEREVIDYVLKDSEFALGTLVSTVKRALANRQTNILVVDDMASSRALLARMLRIQQYAVTESGSGAEALAILDKNRDIALVVADYNMPDMDGFELTLRIRRSFPADAVRVIGVSSSINPTVSAGFLKAGAHDFISRPFIPEELQCRIANNAETLVQMKQLQNLASRDFLTGLFNRRYFFDRGPKLVAGAQGRGDGSCVAILDIDHFKGLNDTYGHDLGDKALKMVSDCLTEAIEGTDALLARLGGEEFAVVFPGADLRQAAETCDRLRLLIAEAEVVAGEETVSVTVSIGVADSNAAEDFDRDLNRADASLFAAKQGGRNRVVRSLSRVVEAEMH